MKNKKSQGMSVNVIIVAAVALIVLVVLVAVFTGRFGVFAGGVKTTGDPTKPCTSTDQGFSVEEKDDKCPEGRNMVAARVGAGKVCCTK